MDRRIGRSTRIVGVAVIAWLVAALPSLAGTVVYSNDMEKGVGTEWSVQRMEATPRGDRRFLGRFRHERVGLKLAVLPRHAWLRVSFELLVMGTWDGNAGHTPRRAMNPVGPDVWRMGVEGGAVLVDATFSNLDFASAQTEEAARTQSYPSVLMGESLPAKTGAAERNTLGCQWVFDGVPRAVDSVYAMSFVIPHEAAVVGLFFEGGSGLQPNDDECWGLRNVRVEALGAAEVAKLDVDSMRRLWEAVGGRDPVGEAAAFWRLVAGGDETARFLRAQFLAGRVKRLGVDRGRFDSLVAQLDGSDFAARERATAAIRAMGPGAAPLVREAIERADSAEVRGRLQAVLKGLGSTPVTDPETRRSMIAVRLLGVIGTAEARRVAGEVGG